MHLTMTRCLCEELYSGRDGNSLPAPVVSRLTKRNYWRFSFSLMLLLLFARPLAAQNDFPLPVTRHPGSEPFQASPETQMSPARQVGEKPPRRLTRSNSTQSSASPRKSGERETTGYAAVRTFGALAFVVALILVGAKLWKKHAPASTRRLSTEAIDILGRKSIEQGLSIYLIRCGNRILVVGSSADGLQTLTEVTDPAEVDYMAGLCHHSSDENRQASPFFSMFNRQFATPKNSARQEQDYAEEHAETQPQTIGQINIEPSQDHDENLETVYG